ncbi:alpha/beta hydrolase [uncultured Formosa sp.]|uniref:alpha/beta fold hydrolase n=1 Tax=uncultured Formosa sp. TaxID=255435 RepID=UPI00262E6947|nr:alpha/beta hydrolase [uncultured Formosa sp.]
MKPIKSILLCLITLCFSQLHIQAQENSDKPIFILVHGTFQWGGQWNLLKSDLVSKGYVVYNPTLTGLGEKNHLLSKETGISTHINDIVNFIEWNNLDNIILVAHSYGGPVISGVVDKIGNKIKHQVYIDCAPADHGENTLDVFGPEVARISLESAEKNGDGWLITADALREPIPTMSKHPLKSYLERVEIVNDIKTDGTIILATEAMSIFGYMRTISAPKKAQARHWKIVTIEGPHTLQEQDPSRSEISNILVNIYKSI